MRRSVHLDFGPVVLFGALAVWGFHGWAWACAFVGAAFLAVEVLRAWTAE